MRRDVVWQDPEVVASFVHERRGAVPYGADQLAMMVRVVAAGGRPVRRVLDVGCGSGVVTAAILARFPDARAVLVDFSAPMLDEARAALGSGEPALRFVTGDLAMPSWLDGIRGAAPFDVVASSYAIHHLSDARKRALYAELYALLAPGGIFVNVEHVASAGAWGEALSDDVMVDALCAHQAAGGERAPRAAVAARFATRPDKAANVLAPLDVQCGWLREIGFVDVDCFFKVVELAVFGGRKPA
ncbi:MAG TPA: class I SAM-dependent methyltransferase [Candidatus Dormibacteraeota bacterium]|nr:class I SAM-dependent methyltransferase [Candidatus Dormibacteraeota bacterium]